MEIETREVEDHPFWTDPRSAKPFSCESLWPDCRHQPGFAVILIVGLTAGTEITGRTANRDDRHVAAALRVKEDCRHHSFCWDLLNWITALTEFTEQLPNAIRQRQVELMLMEGL